MKSFTKNHPYPISHFYQKNKGWIDLIIVFLFFGLFFTGIFGITNDIDWFAIFPLIGLVLLVVGLLSSSILRYNIRLRRDNNGFGRYPVEFTLDDDDEFNKQLRSEIFSVYVSLSDSNYKDISQYGEMLSVLETLAKENGFSKTDIINARNAFEVKNGKFDKRLVDLNKRWL